MPWYSFLLAPFALIFRIITGIRNFLFEQGVFKSHQSSIPTLVVGNLSVGGTGKTPMVEFLIRNLRSDYHLVSLSRGYGRKTKGFLRANSASTPDGIGDEPLQIFRNFNEEIPVIVGEDRVAALAKISNILPETELAILDDAFQHRRLSGDYYCLLTPYSSPFSKDYLLPMGRLRESRGGAFRADIVIVTKCPRGLSPMEMTLIKKDILRYTKRETPILFSNIAYGQPYALDHKQFFSGSVILLSGLADDRPFLHYCQSQFDVLDVLTYPDHFAYTATEVNKVMNLALRHRSKDPVLLTTQKDAVKLKSLANQGFLGEIPIFVLPVEAKFESKDEQMLLSNIREKFRKK